MCRDIQVTASKSRVVEMLAYPYLIGRSKKIGNRRILGPDFAEHRDVARILLEAAKNSGRPKWLRVAGNSSIGRITFFSSLEEARNSDIGADGSDLLRDESGRPIFLVRGLIFVGAEPIQDVTQAHFDFCRPLFTEYFERFWESEKWSVSQSSSSSPIDLSGCNPSVAIEWTSIEISEENGAPVTPVKEVESRGAPNLKAVAVFGTVIALVLAIIMVVADRVAKLDNQ